MKHKSKPEMRFISYENFRPGDYKPLDNPNVRLVYNCYDNVLPDILNNFADFLRGCGFTINGDLVVEPYMEAMPDYEDSESDELIAAYVSNKICVEDTNEVDGEL